MYDFIFLTETWSSEEVDMSVDGFIHYSLHRTDLAVNAKRSSGGICCYIKNKYADKVKFIKSHSDDILWLKFEGILFDRTRDIYVALSYLVPENSGRSELADVSLYNRLLEDIILLTDETNSRCDFLCLGDFNSRVGSLADFVDHDELDSNVHILPDDYSHDLHLPRSSQDSVVNRNGKLLIEFCKESGLRIINGRVGDDAGVGKYTFNGFQGKSVVDYVITSQTLMSSFQSFVVDEPNIFSDHCLISFSFKNGISSNPDGSVRDENNNRDSQGSKLSYMYKWDSAKANAYKCNLNKEETVSSLDCLIRSLNNLNEANDIDKNLEEFSDIINKVCDPIFGKKVNSNEDTSNYSCYKESNNAWFDQECKEKREDFYISLNRYRQCKNEENRVDMCTCRTAFKNIIRNKKFLFRKQNTQKFENARYSNARLYWKLLKNSSSTKGSPKIKPDAFANYFNAINNPEDRFYQADDDIIDFNERYLDSEIQIMFEELDAEIHESEILKAIKELKTNSSGGPDLLLNEFFIHGKGTLLPYLKCLFNTCLNNGYFPSSWSDGYIVPIPKPGDPNDPSNYRGITLLSALGKLFTRILNSRLDSWAENYSVYIEAQAGFRRGMSTVDNVFILQSLVNHCFNENKKLFCAFVDFKKAFDFVVRDILWFKLIKYGVRGNILSVIKSMYNNISSKVKCQNTLSESFTCNLGVRQGECLSPFLFSLFLNDIEETFLAKGVEGIEIGDLKLLLLLYADDIILFAKDAQELQNSLDVLEDYCKRWRLTVNTTKTKIMIFQKGGRLPSNLHFTYDGNDLEIVKLFKYLGVMFSSGGSFKETDLLLSGQATKAIFKMNSYLHKFTDLSPKHTLELFDKLILPILNYGSEVWGFHNGIHTERTQLNFCKRLLGVKTSTQNNFVFGETGRCRLQNIRIFNIIKYWSKLCMTRDSKYIKIVYNSLKQKSDENGRIINWVSKVKGVLSKLGFYEVWLQQGAGNTNVFLSLVKQRISDIYIQEINDNLHTSSRALLYRNLFDNNLAKYLDIITVRKYRIALSRLRVSSHRLAIESGRWRKPESVPFDQRVCSLCNVLEDEFHFVLKCEKYNELRSRYIKKYYWNHPSMEKFIQLLKDENSKVIRNLAVFAYKAFIKRQESFANTR